MASRKSPKPRKATTPTRNEKVFRSLVRKIARENIGLLRDLSKR